MSYPNPYSGYNYQFQSYQQPTDSYQQPNYPQPTYDQTQYNYQYQQPYQQQQQPQQQYEQQQSYSSEYNPNQYSTQSSYTSPTAPKYTPPPQSPYEQPSVYSYAYPKTQTRWLQNYNSQADAYKGNLKQVFDDIDKNRSGHLDFAELTTAMQTLGEDASPSTIELMIQMFDKNQSGSIDFTEFGELYAYIQEMRTAFNGADQDHSRSLGIEQVQAAMSRIHGPWLVVGGGVLLFTLFKLFDKNKQGKLDWHHFLEMGLKFAGLRSRFEHNPYGITGGKHSLNAQAPSSTASQTGFNAGIPPFSAGSNQGPIFGQSQQQPFAQQPQQNFNQPPQQSYGQQQNRPPQPPFNQQFNQPNQQPSGQGYPAYPSSGAPILEIPPFNPGKMDTFGQFAQFAQNLLNRDLPIDISSFQS